MKNIIKKIFGFLAAFLMVFALVGCDKSSKVKKAFEKNDYTVSTGSAQSVSKYLTSLTDDQRKELESYEIITATKNLINVAVIIKFPSSKDVKSFLTTEDENGKKDTSAYDNAKDTNKINGNCLLVFSTSTDEVNIFKKA